MLWNVGGWNIVVKNRISKKQQPQNVYDNCVRWNRKFELFDFLGYSAEWDVEKLGLWKEVTVAYWMISSGDSDEYFRQESTAEIRNLYLPQTRLISLDISTFIFVNQYSSLFIYQRYMHYWG
jgi:hypothetical protein